MVKAGSSSRPASVRLPFWAGLFFRLVVVECGRPAFDFERGGSWCGLAGGASGSGELQGYMPWAVSSPCQRTGEMLLKGQ